MTTKVFSILLALILALSVGLVACGGGEEEEEEEETYDLTIGSTAGGLVTVPGEGVHTYEQGEVVNLVAEADEGYHFVNWTGDVGTIDDVNDASTTINMSGDYSITANFGEVPPLTFTIAWFDFWKEGTYNLGEPIFVFLILTNETQEPITVNQRFAVNAEADVLADLGEVFFIVSDAESNPLPFLARVNVSGPEAEDFTTLQPGGVTVWIIRLTSFYDLTNQGNYTVRAVYHSEVLPEGTVAWSGTLESNTLALTIQ